MKYLLILLGILAVTAMYLSARLDYTKKALERSESQKTAFENEIKRREQNEVELRVRIKELQQAINNDKSGFDWDYNIVNAEPTTVLRKQCKSCKAKAN